MMGGTRGLAVFILALCFFVHGRLVGQTVTGSLQGRVLSISGAPEPGVSVVVSGPNLQGVRTATTASDGVFRVLALPPGNYTVRLSRVGLQPTVLQDVVISLGRETTLGSVRLEARAVMLEEMIITAPATTVDPVHTTVGANLEVADFENLPAQRDYRSAIAILPHITESFRGDVVNIGGQGGPESAYFIDGVNATSSMYGGGISTSLPYNFVRAIEVKAGGYEAQYGKAVGAVVNAITYSGTNDFEANAFGFFTHGSLSFDPKAEPTLTERSSVSYDVGLRVSGPVLRDRLWYSAAYNPVIDRREKEIAGHGFYDDRRTAHRFAGKLTWQATQAMNLELSVLGDPTVHHNIAPPLWSGTLDVAQPEPYLQLRTTGGVVASLRATAALGDRLLIEGSLSRSRAKDNLEADTEIGRTEPLFMDYVANTVSGGVGLTWFSTETRWTARARATLLLDQHSVTLGGEYEDVAPFYENRPTGPDESLTWVERYIVDSWGFGTEDGGQTTHNRVPTLFLQDAWRLTDRFTINAGLRWSSQYLIGASGTTRASFTNQWQPRVGFVMQLGRPGTQRLFGSYGRFYLQQSGTFGALYLVDYTAIYGECDADPREPAATCDITDASHGELDLTDLEDSAVEHVDEFTLGYERLLGGRARATVRGIHRALRSSFQWGVDPSSESFWVFGTPGNGDFAFLPSPERQYTALELSIDGAWRSLDYRASYVLSRTWGNYTGYFAADWGVSNPGGNAAFFIPDHAENTTGLMPNDRTHVFKLTAGYRTGFGLRAGAFLSWQSGTPINELGTSTLFGLPVFLVQRGSAGRTPSLWDLNLRLAYDAPCPGLTTCRLIFDALHIGNPQEVAWVDETRYYATDENGNPASENPNYLMPRSYQPPMMARVGVELGF